LRFFYNYINDDKDNIIEMNLETSKTVAVVCHCNNFREFPEEKSVRPRPPKKETQRRQDFGENYLGELWGRTLTHIKLPGSELVAVPLWFHMRALTGRVQNEWRSMEQYP